jgi:hypothetical protein
MSNPFLTSMAIRHSSKARTLALVLRRIPMVQVTMIVMPGLVPGIHGNRELVAPIVDGRDEPGHDGWVNLVSASTHLAG